MRLLEPFARYKTAKYLMTKSDLRQETSRTADLRWDTHLTWHWPRPINMPNCNSIRPVVFAQGSGDLASRHVCELSSNHEHSPLLWQTNRHDDEKHAAQLKLRSEKMNRPINSGKRVDRFSAELSRFVRLDRFQGLCVMQWNSMYVLPESESNCVYIHSPMKYQHVVSRAGLKLASFTQHRLRS